MKKLILLAAVVMIAGCAFGFAHHKLSAAEAAEVELLRRDAERKHLHWHIICDSSEDAFMGMAFEWDMDWHITTDEKSKPFWTVNGKTQGDTAHALLQAIQRKPNRQPFKSSVTKQKECPPEISDSTK